MRETEKIFINNKFCGYGFKRNHQERVVNRTSTNDTTNTTEIIHKLGQLEDIEEELGIDLITLFKTLKEGVYTRQYEKVEVCCIGLGGLLIEVNDNLRDTYYYYEYGKTWALAKEELEK